MTEIPPPLIALWFLPFVVIFFFYCLVQGFRGHDIDPMHVLMIAGWPLVFPVWVVYFFGGIVPHTIGVWIWRRRR